MRWDGRAPGIAPLRGGEGARTATERAKGQRCCLEKRREAGEDQAAISFYRFITPGLHGRKTKNRNQRAITHVRRYFCPPTSPGVSAMGFPCQPQTERQSSRLQVEKRAPIPGGREHSTDRPVSLGGKREAAASVPLFPTGLILFSTQPHPSRPLLPLIICNFCSPSHQLIKRAAGVSGKACRLSRQNLSGI